MPRITAGGNGTKVNPTRDGAEFIEKLEASAHFGGKLVRT